MRPTGQAATRRPARPRSVPPDAMGLPEAGAKALGRLAPRDASAYTRFGLSALRRSPTVARIETRRGGVAEWLKAHAWNACIPETVSRVRIPLPPPYRSPIQSDSVRDF